MKSGIFVALLIAMVPLSTLAAGRTAPSVAAAGKNVQPDSVQMERDLQRMDWKRFRAVIEAIPKLREDVEAYGEAGWTYVRSRYATYPWKKKIDKLDPDQQRQLADLIRRAKRQPG